jgi:hypothetical protein
MSAKVVPPKPSKTPAKGEKAVRLAEALRANLARRKAQKRARAAPDTGKEQD